MKTKGMAAFLVCSVLAMSFVVTYDIKESGTEFAYAGTIGEESPVYADTPVKEIKYDIEKDSIGYETKIVYSNDHYVDYSEVIQDGCSGIKKSVYSMIYEDGKLISRSLEDEFLKEPKDKIIEMGTKERIVATSRGGFRFTNQLEMVATAYDLSYESTGKYPGDPYYGITASGTKAQPGTVAVDPSVIPLGTKLYIASTDGSPDYGFATALDTGGAIKGNRIDLFMENGKDALNFGIRHVKVYVLE
jgi:3D (Asp-Asp-Asp) domain-containing protein